MKYVFQAPFKHITGEAENLKKRVGIIKYTFKSLLRRRVIIHC